MGEQARNRSPRHSPIPTRRASLRQSNPGNRDRPTPRRLCTRPLQSSPFPSLWGCPLPRSGKSGRGTGGEGRISTQPPAFNSERSPRVRFKFEAIWRGRPSLRHPSPRRGAGYPRSGWRGRGRACVLPTSAIAPPWPGRRGIARPLVERQARQGRRRIAGETVFRMQTPPFDLILRRCGRPHRRRGFID
jgi:hypothetical protein